ncbi:MAG: hypothetical protein AAFZ17_04175 [Cyanobacteria bacterium J06650_10]
MREKPLLPIPHSFAGKLEASQKKELGDIPIAEFVANATKQHLKDDIGGNFDEIARRISALVEGATTAFSTKHLVTQAGFTLER